MLGAAFPLHACTLRHAGFENCIRLQEWKDATQAHTSIPFNRSYAIRNEPGTILKQNVGSFTLRNGASVHIRSFGIFNLSLWDDVMADFAPVTKDDIIVVGEHAWPCCTSVYRTDCQNG